tara:strand:+ start:450 stop:587 length:138 start_codon:yes stop_codon:yes gene_type:complete
MNNAFSKTNHHRIQNRGDPAEGGDCPRLPLRGPPGREVNEKRMKK